MAIKAAKTPFGPIHVHDNDHIGQSFLRGDYYEKGAIDEILKQCGPRRRLAIDIGANYGAHSVMYAQKFQNVVAFEPQTHLFELLEKNLEVPGTRAKCTAYNIALGHRPGKVNIDQCKTKKETNYGSRAISLSGSNTEMRTLDSFAFDGVDLIKVDVEGAESIVFAGALETIRKWQPILFFEFDKFDEFNDANGIPEKYRVDLLGFLFSECQYRSITRLGKKNLLCLPRKQT